MSVSFAGRCVHFNFSLDRPQFYIQLYFNNLMVASKYTKKYINKYNTTKKKEKKNKILR